jgi:hypothetical protein
MRVNFSKWDTWRRRAVKELGALEDVLVALRGEHQIVLGQVVPHEAVLVAPGDTEGMKPSSRYRQKVGFLAIILPY